MCILDPKDGNGLENSYNACISGFPKEGFFFIVASSEKTTPFLAKTRFDTQFVRYEAEWTVEEVTTLLRIHGEYGTGKTINELFSLFHLREDLKVLDKLGIEDSYPSKKKGGGIREVLI